MLVIDSLITLVGIAGKDSQPMRENKLEYMNSEVISMFEECINKIPSMRFKRAENTDVLWIMLADCDLKQAVYDYYDKNNCAISNSFTDEVINIVAADVHNEAGAFRVIYDAKPKETQLYDPMKNALMRYTHSCYDKPNAVILLDMVNKEVYILDKKYVGDNGKKRNFLEDAYGLAVWSPYNKLLKGCVSLVKSIVKDSKEKQLENLNKFYINLNQEVAEAIVNNKSGVDVGKAVKEIYRDNNEAMEQVVDILDFLFHGTMIPTIFLAPVEQMTLKTDSGYKISIPVESEDKVSIEDNLIKLDVAYELMMD